MKKFVALMCVASTVAAGSGLSGQAQACGHSSRVVYVQPQHRVAYAAPAVRATPVVYTTNVVRKPVITTTVERREVLEIQKKLVEIANGSVVKARVRFAGSEQGEVTVRSGNLELQCPIVEWTPNYVTFQLPEIEVLEDAEVSLTIFKATGSVAKSVDALLISGADFEIGPATTALSQASEGIVR